MRRNRKKPDALTDLRKRLGSPSSDVRYQTYLDTQALSAEQLWEIVAVPARDVNHSSRLGTISNIIAGTWVVLGLLAINSAPYMTPFIASSIFIAWVIYVFTFFRRVPQQHLYVSVSRLLEHQEDARFVGPALLIYAEVAGRDVQASIRQTLLRLLPLLDDMHTRQWAGRQKASLTELARHSWGDLELKFFALDALARVGEANSVPVVREVAEMSVSDIAEQLYAAHSSRETTLRELEREQQMEQAIKHGEMIFPAFSVPRDASFDSIDTEQRETYLVAALYLKRKAEDSLNSILARQQQQQQMAVLLRAAEQPAMTQAQGLLRPAHDAGADTPNEQLLRPK